MILKHMLFTLAIAAILPAIAGCSSTLKAGQLGEGGQFESNAKISPSDIKVYAPFEKATSVS